MDSNLKELEKAILLAKKQIKEEQAAWNKFYEKLSEHIKNQNEITPNQKNDENSISYPNALENITEGLEVSFTTLNTHYTECISNIDNVCLPILTTLDQKLTNYKNG